MISKEKLIEVANKLQYLEAYYTAYYDGYTFEINNGELTDYHENERGE